MPAIITSKFRRNNAQQFEESFGEASPNIYYLGIGKPTAFGTKTRADSTRALSTRYFKKRQLYRMSPKPCRGIQTIWLSI